MSIRLLITVNIILTNILFFAEKCWLSYKDYKVIFGEGLANQYNFGNGC